MKIKSILFFVPHLLDGYMSKFVYLMAKDIISKRKSVYIIEYSNVYQVYSIQRKKIDDLLENRIFTLYGEDEDKSTKLLTLIKDINPDIIHIQEFPELWLPDVISKTIYLSKNKYRIVETGYDDNFDFKRKVYFPDGFIFTNSFQSSLFKDINKILQIPYNVIKR